MAGEVIAVGEDVKQWKSGDRVCANFFLDKLNHVQTPETDGSALGGAVQGVLTEYRAFPAHVGVTSACLASEMTGFDFSLYSRS
jgi:NADPH:quinone reductase-like Zn-dependent oxidoreductase